METDSQREESQPCLEAHQDLKMSYRKAFYILISKIN